MRWYCIGEPVATEGLLALVSHVGKKRSVGDGAVERWEVVRCEPWVGFPVVRDGYPLRALPIDWPGVTDADRAMRVLTPPYWERWREVECVVPTVAE
jgi:CRISPR type IV-associated protein Csf3